MVAVCVGALRPVLTVAVCVGALRSVLSDFTIGVSSRGVSSVRKITPVPSLPLLAAAAPAADRSLQVQLEENFFHNHPASLKRTVDFVADRVASNHIKLFRAGPLPAALQRAYTRARQLVLESQRPRNGKMQVSSPCHSYR